MSELSYKGVRITQKAASTQFTQTVMGFQVTHVYQTIDDFDDHALSVIYSNFGSPVDACMAVDIDQWQMPQYGPKAGSWRFSCIMAMRAKPATVREALLGIEDCLLICERHDADPADVGPADVGPMVLDLIRKLELDIR